MKQKLKLYRGLGKKELSKIKLNNIISHKTRYGVSHWTTNKSKAKRYAKMNDSWAVISIVLPVDEITSRITGQIRYPVLKNKHIRHIGGNEYAAHKDLKNIKIKIEEIKK